MKDFRKLQTWRKAHALALHTYKATAKLPRDELYGLTSQIRRACTSIPTDIAEGCGRGTDREFARFAAIALGSASELEYLLPLVGDLRLLDRTDLETLRAETVEVKRMLTSLQKRLRADSS